MVIAALIVDGLFSGAGLIPHTYPCRHLRLDQDRLQAVHQPPRGRHLRRPLLADAAPWGDRPGLRDEGRQEQGDTPCSRDRCLLLLLRALPARLPSRSTAGPGRSATAAGTPHPSDALTAASAGSLSLVCSYSEDPNTPLSSAGLRHPAPAPVAAARAAAAYFSRTVSRTCSATAVAVPAGAEVEPAAQPHASPWLSPQQEAFSEGSQQLACAAGVQHEFSSSAIRTTPPARRGSQSNTPTAPAAQSRQSRLRAAP